MYRAFYQLTDEPFRLTPDPHFLHLSEPHRAAFATLLEGIFYRKGLIMITGPIGTGKTTLIHSALQLISDKKVWVKSALIFNPVLTRDEFLEMVLEEFEVTCQSTSKPRRLSALQQMLLEGQRRGGTSVLFIDEAHLLSPELLEEIRLLGNADTHHEKLLQIVLCGQPELTTMLNRRELSALQQRIAARAHLRPLSLAETQAYIAERLHAAGLRGPSPFVGCALESVYRYSEGVPRVINLLCDGCLTLGFRTERKMVQPDMVEEVAASLGIPDRAAAEEVQAKAAASPEASGAPRTAMHHLIEAMKRNRASARGGE